MKTLLSQGERLSQKNDKSRNSLLKINQEDVYTSLSKLTITSFKVTRLLSHEICVWGKQNGGLEEQEHWKRLSCFLSATLF